MFLAREASWTTPAAGGLNAIREAASRVAGRLEELAANQRAAGPDAAAVLEAQALMVRDPALESAAGELLAGGASVEAAVRSAAERYATELEQLPDPYLSERAADVREAARLLLAQLAGITGSRLDELSEPSIVVARELAAADLLAVHSALQLGLVTETGGATSHLAIVARELGLPAVVGVGGVVAAAQHARAAELDGARGEVRLLTRAVGRAAGRRGARRLRVDRAPVRLMANVGSAEAARSAASRGAAGAGLFRTELLFLGRSAPPSEDLQAEEYAAACRAFAPHPVLVRTLDAGSDKALPYLALEPEANPALGRRGIRLWLAHQELHEPQVRALVRVGAESPNLRVMLPMVGVVNEVREAAALLRSEARRRRVAPPPLGMMVEVPAVAAGLDGFAGAVDFISLGTNDLAQYALAADRELHWRPGLDEFHPGVLKLIAGCLESASRLGLEAGVCGEMAGTAVGAVFLAGAGATSLSMGLESLGPVLRVLVRMTPERLRNAAMEALAAPDGRAARRALGLKSSSGSGRSAPGPPPRRRPPRR